MLSLTLASITSVLNTTGHTAAFVVASELHPDVGLGRAKKNKKKTDGRKPQGRCRGMTSHANHGHANKLSYITTTRLKNIIGYLLRISA